MDIFTQTTNSMKNMTNDHTIKFKSVYIDIDLAIHRPSNSPRGTGRLQNSLDSHEDFEFTMSNMRTKDDVYEPGMELASADKLFFRGQLLPLQPADPKLQSTQTSPRSKEDAYNGGDHRASLAKHHGNPRTFQASHERGLLVGSEEPSNKRNASEKGLLMMCDSEETSPMHGVRQARYNPGTSHVHHEEFLPESSLLRDRMDILRSCRLDGLFDLFKNDSRSSSFCSHQSSYWSSGEKESRDSISSSRCSNGSYQDSCFQNTEKKAPQGSMLKASAHPISTACVENECDTHNTDPNTCRFRGKPPPAPNTSSKKWSLKGFFTGLRKASKLWADDERGDEGKPSTKGDSGKGVRRSVFTFEELPGALDDPISYGRRSVGSDGEWQASTYKIVGNEGSLRKGRQPTRGWTFGRDESMGTIYCLRSGGRQEAASGAGDGGGHRDKGKELGNAWNAKESWSKCLNKVKKGTRLSYNACKVQEKQGSKSNGMLMSDLEDKMDAYRAMRAKSLSSTPLAKSPVSRPEYSSNGSFQAGYGGLYCVQGGADIATSLPCASSSSMKGKGKKVGFASCPASMRSSPHHSGLLAIVNKGTPDLHTAIQGAIAHCKQSLASNPP